MNSTNNSPNISEMHPEEPITNKKKSVKPLTVFLVIAVCLSLVISLLSLTLMIINTVKEPSVQATAEVTAESKEKENDANNENGDDTEADDTDNDTIFDEPEFVLPEDGVVIAEEYTIRPTTHISDAYLSGDSSGLSEKDAEILEMASEVINECITEDMSDFEKETAIYDWMTANLYFDEGSLQVIPMTEDDADNPYGALKYHNAVCVGYATTFRLFMEMLEIPCRVIPDAYLGHSWNLVQIDGEWYHTDVWSGMESGSYAVFNMTDSMMLNNQEWNYEDYPEANSLTYNIMYMNADECNDVYDIPAIVKSALDSKSNSVSLRFKDLSDNEYCIVDSMLYGITSLTYSHDDYYDMYMEHSITYTDEDVLVVFSVEYYEDEFGDYYEDILSEEDKESMIDALDAAFGDNVDRGFWEGDDVYYY